MNEWVLEGVLGRDASRRVERQHLVDLWAARSHIHQKTSRRNELSRMAKQKWRAKRAYQILQLVQLALLALGHLARRLGHFAANVSLRRIAADHFKRDEPLDRFARQPVDLTRLERAAEFVEMLRSKGGATKHLFRKGAARLLNHPEHVVIVAAGKEDAARVPVGRPHRQ